jgi:hypothetical protein
LGRSSARANLNLRSLRTLLPRTTFLPPINYSGSGGFGIKDKRELKRWSNTWTIDGASPTEHVSKYSMPCFLAKEMASIFETPVAAAPLDWFFFEDYKSSLLPTRILIGESHPLSGPHSDIHCSICSKVPFLVTSNKKMIAVDPLTYLCTYLWCLSFPGMSK